MRRRLFTHIARLATQYPKAVVAAAVALAIASGIYAAKTIRLNANLDELVSMKLDYHRRYIEFLKEFGDEEYLYVVIDAANDLPGAKQFVEVLGGRLKTIPDLKQVIWKIENPALERNFLLYLTPAQLKALSSMMSQDPFSARSIASWNSFDSLFGAMATRIEGPVTKEDEEELTTGFKFIDGLIDDMALALKRGTPARLASEPEARVAGGPYKSRLQELFFGDGETFDSEGFYKNGDLLFILIMPAKDFSTMEVISQPLTEIRRTITQVKEEFPGIDVGLTGRPVLSADEMTTSNRDMTLATLIAFVAVAIVFILFFRGVARPLLAMASLVIGISWTFGFVAIAIGTLNLLSSVFALILIAASIEYSVYITARYEEELARHGVVTRAIVRTLETTGQANVTSALTTAAAFSTLLWTDFTALAQLGAIAAIGIVFCLTAMILVLPAMIVLRDGRRPKSALAHVQGFNAPWLVGLYRRPRILVFASCVVTIVLVPFIARMTYDNNLLNLQARGLESVKYEHLIIEKSSETTWFARAVADTIDESHKKAHALSMLQSVRKVDDVERVLPEYQKAKIQAVRRMAPAFAGLEFADPSDSIDIATLAADLKRLASNLGRLEEGAFRAGRVEAVEELEDFASKVEKLAQATESADSQQLVGLGRMQHDFFADLHKHIEILSTGMHPAPIALADLPADIVGRFVSPKGRYALFIYPRENIWDPEALARFVAEIRAVDPNVTGTPIEVYESGMIMRKTFVRSAVLAFVVIYLLVLLGFRSWRASLLAVLPLVVGISCLLGVAGLFGIPFNMANFFAIPILIGIGVDYGVQLTHRLRQERSFSALGTSTGRAILMTACANGLGFGVMMIAHHQGVASLGKILALGCICCLIAALIVTPPVARWLNWGHKGRDS